ncbi:MAG: methyltransferase type 11 [Roseiflexus castenholzii]|uniref:methyltransferase domain-containing protein n=1 Tax=Roseiflexus castenholzii TaxID=120962 RepID=UPI000CC17940|nr:MAG: methyltransferase type 11 [Roseiflexus castenholzii]
MREIIKEFVSECAAVLPICEPIHEFGAYQVAGQEGFVDLRSLFSSQCYIGSDMRYGPGVDVLLDLHALGLADASVGSALILDTLEHVEKPWRAMEEVHRILKPGGIVLISSVMNFPIHNHPSDYWRFTPEAFHSLLHPFEYALVMWAGVEDFPETVVGVGCKGRLAEAQACALQERLTAWQARWAPRVPPLYERIAKLVAPPIALSAYRALRDHDLHWIRQAWHQPG